VEGRQRRWREGKEDKSKERKEEEGGGRYLSLRSVKHKVLKLRLLHGKESQKENRTKKEDEEISVVRPGTHREVSKAVAQVHVSHHAKKYYMDQ
jgi:hypothetical protein